VQCFCDDSNALRQGLSLVRVIAELKTLMIH
jgi:hypothetical protein